MESNSNEIIALITGSSRGIGWETAKLFAQNNITVIINGVKDQKMIDDRVTELKSISDKNHSGLRYDVKESDAVKQAFAEIREKYNRLDILVNNAGIFGVTVIGMIKEEVIDEYFNVNVKSAILHTQLAAKFMMKQKSGSIVNLTSIMGIEGDPGYSVYSASKSAIIGFTKSASKELAKYGIRVNAVSPGFIDTDMIGFLKPEQREGVVKNISLSRIGSASDVAKSILFLARDSAGYITGEILKVDGGMKI